ncbi:MAG: sigma-70 family RNA polymerase sigma factor [Oscillospiraceae bacterium]|nr:sigma-70 family RNA polymerase sigma factor [Oscillospiraceae bacterium]
MDASDISLANQAELQLLTDAQAGDVEAESALIVKYMPLVKACARPYFLQGGDYEDVYQEGMLGLLSAIRRYDPARGASFKTFADLCVRRRIFSAIKRYSVVDTIDLSALVAEASAAHSDSNPELVLIDREKSEEFLTGFLQLLSSLERKILSLYLDGLSYREIASGTGKSAKSVDNAIQRVKRKLTLFKLGDTSLG